MLGNLLLAEDRKKLILADFGHAREEIAGDMTCESGTYRWMAPEVPTYVSKFVLSYFSYFGFRHLYSLINAFILFSYAIRTRFQREKRKGMIIRWMYTASQLFCGNYSQTKLHSMGGKAYWWHMPLQPK